MIDWKWSKLIGKLTPLLFHGCLSCLSILCFIDFFPYVFFLPFWLQNLCQFLTMCQFLLQLKPRLTSCTTGNFSFFLQYCSNPLSTYIYINCFSYKESHIIRTQISFYKKNIFLTLTINTIHLLLILKKKIKNH